MIPRSLKASFAGLEKALYAFIKIGLTQEEFAKKLQLSRSTIANFLAGKSVDRAYFFKICKGLELNTDEIYEPISTLAITKIINFKEFSINDYCQFLAFLEILDSSYIVIQINEDFQEMVYQEISNQVSQIQLQKNQSIFLKKILKYLTEANSKETLINSIQITKSIVNLSGWFKNLFEGGWQTVEEFLSKRELDPVTNFRSSYIVEPSEIKCVKMIKLINLGTKLRGQSVALVVALNPGTDQKIGIVLQLHPVDNQNHLPFGIQLIILDESGRTFLEAQSRNYDNWIQLEINGESGEFFSVQVALDDYSIIEHFIV